MNQVVITIQYSHNNQMDIALPIDVPCKLLASAIAQAVGLIGNDGVDYGLAIREGGKPITIDASHTLLDASVMFGDRLELVEYAPGSIPNSAAARSRTLVSAFLLFDNGERYKLNPTITRIGRWAPGNGVDVDMTNFDRRKRVSRKHAIIEHRHGSFFVMDDDSTNGTTVNGQKIDQGDKRLLQNGDQIELGGDGGVRTRFVLGASGDLKPR